MYTFTAVCLLLATDGLFAALCGKLIAQFKLLNKEFKINGQINLKTEDYIMKLEEDIRYHLKLIV